MRNPSLTRGVKEDVFPIRGPGGSPIALLVFRQISLLRAVRMHDPDVAGFKNASISGSKDEALALR